MSYSSIHKRTPIRRGGFQTRPTFQTRPLITCPRVILSHIANLKGVEQNNNPMYMIRHHHEHVQ